MDSSPNRRNKAATFAYLSRVMLPGSQSVVLGFPRHRQQLKMYSNLRRLSNLRVIKTDEKT